MLKVYGNIYSENKDDFNEMIRVLESSGFQIAYRHPNNADVIKEVSDEETESEE